MKKLGKILVWAVLALVVVLALGITFTIGWRPFIGPQARTLTARKFDSTPVRLAAANISSTTCSTAWTATRARLDGA